MLVLAGCIELFLLNIKMMSKTMIIMKHTTVIDITVEINISVIEKAPLLD